MSGLVVTKPGVFATLQDWGRYGQRKNGLSTGGPMDEHAYCWANYLLANPVNSTTVEITVGLSEFESLINTHIAICGAEMGAMINNMPIANWSTHPLNRGDILKFKSSQKGMRSYLAIKQGFTTKPLFNSTATVAREKLGGLNGEVLQKNDIVTATPNLNILKRKTVPFQFIPDYGNSLTIPFIPGYQYELFDDKQVKRFTCQTFTVSQRMDRMGARLEGEKIDYTGPGIISEGIAVGSIQIPPDGQPIILLKDCGSIGGYPKLGCVSRMGLTALAQARPGNTVKFVPVDNADATNQLLEFQNFFNLS